MNARFSDNYIKQMDAQLDGNLISLANKYEAVTGQQFEVHYGHNALFSMLKQAMMTEHKEVLRLTVEFVANLPGNLQKDFQDYSRRHGSNIGAAPASAKTAFVGNKFINTSKEHSRRKKVAGKLWSMLHLKRTA